MDPRATPGWAAPARPCSEKNMKLNSGVYRGRPRPEDPCWMVLMSDGTLAFTAHNHTLELAASFAGMMAENNAWPGATLVLLEACRHDIRGHIYEIRRPASAPEKTE